MSKDGTEDKITSIQVHKSLIEELEPFRKEYGSYEKGIKMLVEYFENEEGNE